MECIAPVRVGRRRSIDCSLSTMTMLLRSRQSRRSSSTWNIYEPQNSFSDYDSGSGDESPTDWTVGQDTYENQKWYAGKITRIMAEKILEDLRDGAFLVRNSTEPNSEYTYTIAIKWMNRCFHLRIYKHFERLSVTTDSSHTFGTMEELIGHFEEHSLGIYFPSINTVLRYPYKEEQYNGQTSDECPRLDNSSTASSVVDSLRPVDVTLPLIEQPWYHGAMTRADAEKLLSTKPVGSFLLRDSESYRTGYSLSIRHSSSDFLHIRVSKINERYILGQYSKPFDTVPQCIAHYCKESLPIKRGVYAALIMPVCR